jgi:hypothetical protein
MLAGTFGLLPNRRSLCVMLWPEMSKQLQKFALFLRRMLPRPAPLRIHDHPPLPVPEVRRIAQNGPKVRHSGILTWESYGEAAKQIIASWAAQLGWPVSLLSQLGSLLPATNSPSGSEIVAAQSSIPAVQASTPGAPQAAPVAQVAPDTIAAAVAPAVPSPDQQQLEAIARDLGSVQQNAKKLLSARSCDPQAPGADAGASAAQPQANLPGHEGPWPAARPKLRWRRATSRWPHRSG